MAEMITHEELAKLIEGCTCEVASTMLGLELEVGEPFRLINEPAPKAGVVSLIGLAGDWIGTGSLACNSEMACLLSSHLLMSEYSTVNEEVLDAMAEITNMIVGNVKTHLEEQVGPLGLSIPTVVFGLNFTTRSIGRHEWTVVPFRHAGHCLEVHLCLAPNKDGRAAVRAGLDSCEATRRN